MSSTCLERLSVHLQEDLYMHFCGISFLPPYKQSGRREDVLVISYYIGISQCAVQKRVSLTSVLRTLDCALLQTTQEGSYRHESLHKM